MSKSRLLTLGLLASLAAAPAFAQDAAPTPPTDMTAPPAAATTNGSTEIQRNVNQQERIEQGLKSGELTTGEAAKLEKGEQRIDNAEARAEKGGVTPTEQAKIQQMQNAESAKIYQDKHNTVTGNPASASSQRMQNDVQRDVNQQTRIEQGVKSGNLTDKETSKLEKGQAHESRAQARAGRNGKVTAREQARLQRQENRKSGKILHAKHNHKTTGGNNATPAATSSAAPATTGQ